MTQEEGVGQTTLWEPVRKDLGFHSYKKEHRQLLSVTTKEKRLVRGCQVLRRLTTAMANGMPPPVLWSDEKLFSIKAIYNPQNDRVE